MKTMIERATIAIHDEMDPSDELDMAAAERYARAALAAIREPTEGMIEAGWIDKEDVSPREIFAAMIDAALGGK